MIRGQASLEYLLVLAGFFAIFAALLPSIAGSIHAFTSAQDAVLAKQISGTLQGQARLFGFLADGSKKTFEYSPTDSIAIWSLQNKVMVSSGEREFEVKTNHVQNIPKQEFTEKFAVEIEKVNGKTVIRAYPA